MRRRRTRDFSAPFVVIVALGPACGGSRSAPPPRVTPKGGDVAAAPYWFDDPVCWHRTPEGGREPADCTDELLPEPPDDRLVIADDGRCFRVYEGPDDPVDWNAGRVRCPDNGATAIVPEVTTIGKAYDRVQIEPRTLTCSQEVFANPPYWKPTSCPARLLPWLAGGVVPTKKEGGRCFWQSIEVRCDPPDADAHPQADARIINVEATASGSVIVINVGTAQGLSAGMVGEIPDVAKGSFTISSCSAKACKATTAATADDIRASRAEVVLDWMSADR